SDSLRDGSLENGGIRPNSSWTETGAVWVIAVCESGAPCGSFSSTTAASHGDILAWFGGVNSDTVGINQSSALPVGTVALQLTADTNFETEEVAGDGAYDLFTARITNTGGAELYEIVSFSNEDAAQVGTATWANDGIDVSFDATAWAGGTIKLEMESVTDPSSLSDFFIDN